MNNRLFASKKNRVTHIAITIAVCVALFSCTNDMEKIAKLTSTTELPSIIVKDIETIYSDSAVVKVRLTASEFQRYDKKDQSYDEYPSGLKVEFYNNQLQVVGQLTCEYARYYSSKNLWEARKNVEAVNFGKNEKINTEMLYWDIESEQIYTDEFVRITTQDEIIYGDGLHANQDFSAWKITKPKGTITIQDEE